MSPNVGNFVHDLVEMAKAMETLPQVEAALRTAEQSNRQLSETVASREEAILRYKAEIETLNAKVRATEAERDDAELRFLETDERLSHVLSMVKASQVGLEKAVVLLDPPKPVPMPEPVYTTSGFEGQREGNPISTGSTETLTPTTDAPVDTSPQTANPTEPVASTVEIGPYSGKRYYDHPTYVHRDDWVAGGGTEADYEWRPAPTKSAQPIW